MIVYKVLRTYQCVGVDRPDKGQNICYLKAQWVHQLNDTYDVNRKRTVVASAIPTLDCNDVLTEKRQYISPLPPLRWDYSISYPLGTNT